MKQLDVTLAARSFVEGRAIRTTLFRHRRLGDEPLMLVLWQLGAEPFSLAAASFGRSPRDQNFVVAGDPRNRDLAFAALLKMATWFNGHFEAPSADREEFEHWGQILTRSRSAPQIVVANGSTIEMLGRLGRRLAYLRTDGPKAAPLELVRFGRHLLFLSSHARMPGQQIVIALTELVGSNWATGQSPEERLSLAALNAYISPSKSHAFYEAMKSERYAIGPVPSGEDDENLEPLVEAFNQRRSGDVSAKVVAPLLKPIEDHYRRLVGRTWRLAWDCYERETKWPEAPSVGRRWDLDREAYTQHIDWTMGIGRRRTRQTPRQAAILLRRLEEAKATLEAEEACDDALRMIPYLLDGKAIQGRVIQLDLNNRELANTRMVRRPLVVISSPDPCLMPCGKELWWSVNPDGKSYEVTQVRADEDGGSIVTLKLTTSSKSTPMPRVGQEVCFSIHTTGTVRFFKLPPTEPWTHRPEAPVAEPVALEDSEIRS